MSHPIYRVRWFEIVAPYTLRVGFDDHNEQTIDFRRAVGRLGPGENISAEQDCEHEEPDLGKAF